MTSTEITILREIVTIQAARRRNYAENHEPQDPDLEARHVAAIADHRATLERIERNQRTTRAAS